MLNNGTKRQLGQFEPINDDRVHIEDNNSQLPLDSKETSRRQVAQEVGRDKAKEINGIADVLGEYGLYQFSLTVLIFIRYVCVAMMTNTGPLIAPDLDFWCEVPDYFSALLPANVTRDYFKEKCTLQLLDGSQYKCSSWSYSKQNGATLTDTFDLICGRLWLRSAFQSTVSIGVTVASLLWGAASDKYGRLYTANVCYLLSLFTGLVSACAPSYSIYAVTRALCSLSDLGLAASLSTIIVETLGNKYRGAVCIIVYTGWAMGVMVMPWIVSYFGNFRHLMLFTVACHLITCPWMLTLGESARWLLVNGRIDEAGREVRRIVRWNTFFNREQYANKSLQSMEKFNIFKKRYTNLEAATDGQLPKKDRSLVAEIVGNFSMVGELFRVREVSLTTITVIWITFNSELIYMFTIMINSDIGDDIKFNYLIGGVMEILATLIAIVMIWKMTRRLSLSVTLLIIASCCATLAFTHDQPNISTWMLNLTKLAESTLASLIYALTTEIFPTNLRQTGIGLTATVGSLGAVIAPFIRTELANLIGMTNVLLILFLFPLSAAILIPLFLRETKGVELPDNIEDICQPSIKVGDARDNSDANRIQGKQ